MLAQLLKIGNLFLFPRLKNHSLATPTKAQPTPSCEHD